MLFFTDNCHCFCCRWSECCLLTRLRSDCLRRDWRWTSCCDSYCSGKNLEASLNLSLDTHLGDPLRFTNLLPWIGVPGGKSNLLGCCGLSSCLVVSEGWEYFCVVRSSLPCPLNTSVDAGTTWLSLLDEVGRIVLAFCEFFIGELLSLE